MRNPNWPSRQDILAAVARRDGDLFDFICSRRTEPLNRLMIFATRSGDGWTYPALAVAGIIVGGASGSGLIAAAATAGGATLVGYCVKRMIARPRPTHASCLRVALVAPPDAWSFPSAHTATAVAAAAALGATFGAPVCCAALTWALFVGISRIYVGAHYPLDVIIGAAIGALAASAFTAPLLSAVVLLASLAA